MKQAKWIWYPGEFEQKIANKILFRRDYRQIIEPPFWKIDEIYPSVYFFKTVNFVKEEKIKVYTNSLISIRCSNLEHHVTEDNDGFYTLPKGSYEIIVSAYNDKHGLPAILIEGETLLSDESFYVSTHSSRQKKVPVGFSDSLTKDCEPNDFALSLEEISYSQKLQVNGYTIYDFGKETFGYIKLYNIKGNGKIFLYYGESIEEALDIENCETYDVVTVKSQQESYVHEHSRGFRYVNVCLEGAEFDEASLMHEYLPVKYRGEFHCSDELVNRIFETSLYTLHLNSRETFLDGIKRDRWFWSGDAYQSYLLNYYSFFDKEINQRTIWALRGKGLVDSHINHIPDYTFYWFISLYDHYLYTKDTAFLRSAYDSAVHLMDYCLELRNEDGFIEGRDCDWVFVDWADMPKDGVLSVEQILFYQALKTMETFAALFEDVQNEQLYMKTSEELKKNIFDTFYDEEKGVFYHHNINGKTTKLVTRYSNIFALMFGLLPEDTKEKTIKNALLNDEIQKIVTPYCKFYEMIGLCEANKKDEVLNFIREYWGGMLNLGATTFWELFDPSQTEHYSMYGRPYGKSLCHAWGASPIYLLGKYFLGVYPTKAGYESYVVSPNLGGLTFIEGKVPTPIGDISVYMDLEKIEVTGIANSVGTIQFGDNQTAVVNGNETVTIKLLVKE